MCPGCQRFYCSSLISGKSNSRRHFPSPSPPPKKKTPENPHFLLFWERAATPHLIPATTTKVANLHKIKVISKSEFAILSHDFKMEERTLRTPEQEMKSSGGNSLNCMLNYKKLIGSFFFYRNDSYLAPQCTVE